MKYRNARIFTLFVSVVLSMAAVAQGQYVARTIKVNVPFEFVVGNKHFDAGDYFLVSNGQLDMQLRDSQSRTLAIIHTKPVESSTRPSKPKLRSSSFARASRTASASSADPRGRHQSSCGRHCCEVVAADGLSHF